MDDDAWASDVMCIYEGFFRRQIMWTVGSRRSNGWGSCHALTPETLSGFKYELSTVSSQASFLNFALTLECLSSCAASVFLLKVSDVFSVSSYLFFFGRSFSSSHASFVLVYLVCFLCHWSVVGQGNPNHCPLEEEVRGDDPGSAYDRSNTPKQPHPYEGPSWVDPKVFGITFVFLTKTSISDFLKRVPVLKANAKESLLSFGPAFWLIQCTGNAHLLKPLFSLYTFVFFSDLHVSLPFDTFTMGVLHVEDGWSLFST